MERGPRRRRASCSIRLGGGTAAIGRRSRIEIRDQLVPVQMPLQTLIDVEALYPEQIERAPLSPADAALGFSTGWIVAIHSGYNNAGRTVARSMSNSTGSRHRRSQARRVSTEPRLGNQPYDPSYDGRRRGLTGPASAIHP